MEGNVSLADIAAVTDKNNCNGFGFGSEGLWIFALLILMFGGNGFGGYGNAATALTQADLQRAIDLNSIQNGQRDIEARTQEVAAEITSAVKDSAYNNLGEIRDLQSATNVGFANMQNCCCEQKSMILENRYLDAQNTASINAHTTEVGQKILDAINTNRIADMQNQINALQMQNAMCGVVRYPTATTYCSGANPFSSYGCGAVNI